MVVSTRHNAPMRWLLAIGLLALSACSSSTPDATPDAGPDGGPPLDAAQTGPFFHEDVEPIVQAHCQTCHRDGGIAPFSMLTYAGVKDWADAMATEAAQRTMPPWGAFDTDTCKHRLGFADDLRLSQKEIDTIVAWAKNGAKEGDPAKAPPPKSFPKELLPGATDTLSYPPYAVAGAGKDQLRCFVVDPKLVDPTWIDGTHVVPGDPRVVHHVLVYTDPKGESRAKADPVTGSYECFGGPQVSGTNLLLAWAPGVPASQYPAGVGLLLPAGALLVVQVHYHPHGVETVTDATTVQLRRAKEPPTWAASIRLIGNAPSAARGLLPGTDDPASGPAFLIPANKSAHQETMEFTLPASTPPVKIASVGSHMHWLGKNLEVDIERPAARGADPAKECLLATPRYDFNWQRGYAYAGPIDGLPTAQAGDKLRVRCTYDNSTANRAMMTALADKKVTSPIDVGLGEETTDEMCLGAFVFYAKVK